MHKRYLILMAISFCLCSVAEAQVLTVRDRPLLPEVEVISDMRGDELTASGIPQPDLVVKELCFDPGKSGGQSTLRVSFANVGPVDAPKFTLGFIYHQPGGVERFVLEDVAGLKSGEQKIAVMGHGTGRGLMPGSWLPDIADRFTAIMDPRYFRKELVPGEGQNGRVQIKSVIPESNESNNSLSAAKSAIRECGSIAPQRVPQVTPVVKPPARP